MSIQTVNGWYIVMAVEKLFIAQINGKLPVLDATDETAMKDAFLQHVKPWIAAMPLDRRLAFKTSLAYFLNRNDFPDLIAPVQDLEMKEPEDNRVFFTWMWNVLYPELSPSDIDTTDVVEDNDSMAMNKFAGLEALDSYLRPEE